MVTKEDLVKGEIYKIWGNGVYLIHKFEKMESKTNSVGYYISNMDNSNFEFRFSTPYIGDRKIEIASYEEKQWLEECILQNTFIPFEQLKLNPQTYELW